MRIAETASHRPLQDHKLSMYQHVSEWEYPSQGGQEPPLGTEPEIAREGRGNADPLTPTMGALGGIGRTPIPVAESTHHPGERPLTPVEVHKRERPDQKGESPTPTQDQGGTTGEAQAGRQGQEPEWALPEPQTHIDLREGGQEKRRYTFGTLRGRMRAPLSRNTSPLTNN